MKGKSNSPFSFYALDLDRRRRRAFCDGEVGKGDEPLTGDGTLGGLRDHVHRVRRRESPSPSVRRLLSG